MNMHELGHLIIVKPAEAKRQILAALKVEKMHKGNAARRLGCQQRTLAQWIDRLGIEAEVEAMIARSIADGWHHGRVGGYPAGRKRSEEDRENKSTAWGERRKRSSATKIKRPRLARTG